MMSPLQRGNSVPGSYYEVLEVALQASAQDIRSAYRKHAAVWHPDKWLNGEEGEQLRAEEKFREITLAYETLGDEEKRCMYNASNSLY